MCSLKQLSVVWLLMLLNGLAHAADAVAPDEAATYFEAFLAQTADWGEFDVKIESSILREQADAGILSEVVIKERFVRQSGTKVYVRSERLAPITGESSTKTTHHLTVTVLSGNEALQRTYPESTNRFPLDEKDRSFEWVCNPPDFRLIGVFPFPFHGGSVSEALVESIRKRMCVPGPTASLVIKSGRAFISDSRQDQNLGATARCSHSFDLDRLLMIQRQWRTEAGERLISGKEEYRWEKIDGRYRPTFVIGVKESGVPDEEGKLVQQSEQFEAKLNWGEIKKKPIENPNELLLDAKSAMEFLSLTSP